MGNIQDRRSLPAGALTSLWLTARFVNVVALCQMLLRPTQPQHQLRMSPRIDCVL